MNRLLILSLLVLSASAFSQEADSANPYVRKQRSGAVMGEIGMNSLASLVGVTGTLFIDRRFAVDLGLGLSSVGLRPGVRGRYQFSVTKFSGFVFGAFKYGLGGGGGEAKVKDPDNNVEYPFEIEPSPYLDLGVGVDYLAHGGFYFLATLGWSTLLGGKNYKWTEQEPREEIDNVMALIAGSGPALSVSFGYAFR